jgi:hypothetical protein
MPGDDFLLFMAYFIKYTMITEHRPILLLLDSQSQISVSLKLPRKWNGDIVISTLYHAQTAALRQVHLLIFQEVREGGSLTRG